MLEKRKDVLLSLVLCMVFLMIHLVKSDTVTKKERKERSLYDKLLKNNHLTKLIFKREENVERESSASSNLINVRKIRKNSDESISETDSQDSSSEPEASDPVSKEHIIDTSAHNIFDEYKDAYGVVYETKESKNLGRFIRHLTSLGRLQRYKKDAPLSSKIRDTSVTSDVSSSIFSGDTSVTGETNGVSSSIFSGETSIKSETSSASSSVLSDMTPTYELTTFTAATEETSLADLTFGSQVTSDTAGTGETKETSLSELTTDSQATSETAGTGGTEETSLSEVTKGSQLTSQTAVTGGTQETSASAVTRKTKETSVLETTTGSQVTVQTGSPEDTKTTGAAGDTEGTKATGGTEEPVSSPTSAPVKTPKPSETESPLPTVTAVLPPKEPQRTAGTPISEVTEGSPKTGQTASITTIKIKDLSFPTVTAVLPGRDEILGTTNESAETGESGAEYKDKGSGRKGTTVEDKETNKVSVEVERVERSTFGIRLNRYTVPDELLVTSTIKEYSETIGEASEEGSILSSSINKMKKSIFEELKKGVENVRYRIHRKIGNNTIQRINKIEKNDGMKIGVDSSLIEDSKKSHSGKNGSDEDVLLIKDLDIVEKIMQEKKAANILYRQQDNVPDRPDEPVIKHIRRNDIKLSWTPPEATFGPIEGYTVEMKEEGGRYEVLEEPEKPSVQIHQLTPGNIYFLRITAWNHNGPSRPLVIMYFMD